jgi:hypothetical protein
MPAIKETEQLFAESVSIQANSRGLILDAK